MDDSKQDPPGGVASIFLDEKNAADRQAEPDLGPPVIDAGGLVTLPEGPGDPPFSPSCCPLVASRTENPVCQRGSLVPRLPDCQTSQTQRWSKAEVCVRRSSLNI